jgi:SET domain-containing protein
LWWPFEVDITLSLVNEPPKNASLGINVCVEDDPNDPDGLIFVADREIMAGEELFIDYGRDYDRSGYQQNKDEKIT